MRESLFIASDHAGYDLKQELIVSKKYEFTDLGSFTNQSADYPDYAKELVKNLNLSPNSRGVLICGTGVGMSIAANRDKNIRAGLAFNSEIAKLIRAHNDANVLVLPGRFMNIQEALKCVENFLITGFEGGRHKNRIGKLI